MRNLIFVLFGLGLIYSCTKKEQSHNYTSVTIQTVFEDTMSIRAIEFLDGNTLAFAGNNGLYGTVATNSGKVRTNHMAYDSLVPEFRAVAHTASDFFMLSVANPALLYKTGDTGSMDLVYKEAGEGVFYDSMTFWNDTEGIAIGDSVGGCLAIITTRDGGKTWQKISCDQLPPAKTGEGAFAASNTNIAVQDSQTWVATTAGRIFYSPDKGVSWQVFDTPIINSEPTQGVYSIDFYDEDLGFGIGGDFTKPEGNTANKIRTKDGGKTWHVMADNKPPGYKSCVQFVPGSGGNDLVALGFTGISYSPDSGETWKALSADGFYTLRFLNDSTAYAAGRNKIARLTFRSE